MITITSLAFAQTAEASRTSDIIYGHKFGTALTLELFKPAMPNGSGVIWVVSSNGISSRDQTFEPSFHRRIQPLLEHGYAVFAVVHGSAPVFNVQDQVRDVQRAVRFVKHRAADFGIDATRLALAGSSSGGLLALIVAMTGQDGIATADDSVEHESTRVGAVGCFFPPTDLLDFGGSGQTILDLMQQGGVIDPSFRLYDPASDTRAPLVSRDEAVRVLGEISPMAQVTADDPPTILVHGDQDRAVPVEQSQRLFRKLTDAKVPARLVTRVNAGHAYTGWESDTALLAEWFDEHLTRH